MDLNIQGLLKREQELQEETKRVRKAIEALREVCPHLEWEDDGRDSHHDYEKCKACGKTQKA